MALSKMQHATRRRARFEMEACLQQGLQWPEALEAALDVYDRAESERRLMEECHCRVREHLAEGRAQIKVDGLIREAQHRARQS